MRKAMAFMLLLGFSGVVIAADDKLDEKYLVGLWSIKLVNKTGKEDKAGHTIEFKEDGSFIWNDGGKIVGTYKVNDMQQLVLKRTGGKSIIWKDMSIKDGKVIRQLGKTDYDELTRIEKKDKN
jgi:hypothetical protein